MDSHETEVRYTVGGTGTGHLAKCTCGWTSAMAATAAYAEALAEQHVQFSVRQPRP